MSETVAFHVYGDTHEECVAAALKRLPELAGTPGATIQRSDDLILTGTVTWAMTAASSRVNVLPGKNLVCEVSFERYG